MKRLKAAAAAAALLAAAPAVAQEDARELVCTMPTDKVKDAVEAFARMMPAFADVRCSNCHGGVNPYTENGGHAGGVIDLDGILEELEGDRGKLEAALGVTPRSADRPAPEPEPESDEPEPEDGAPAPRIDRVESARQAIRTLRDAKGEGLSAGTLAEILALGGLDNHIGETVCAECHQHSPIAWRLAKSPFAGRSQKELCEAFQKHPEVTSPAEFVEHVSRDPLGFIPVGFAGTRGLGEVGRALLPALNGKTYAPEPLRAVTPTELNRGAFDWAHAIGPEYRKPASCGCEDVSYDLHFKIDFDVDYQGGTVRTKQDFKLPVTFVDERAFVAEGATEYVQYIDVAQGADQCKIEQPIKEQWTLKGDVDAEMTVMKIDGNVLSRAQPAMMVCVIEGRNYRQPVPSWQDDTELLPYKFEIAPIVGERKVFRFPHPYGALVVDLAVARRAAADVAGSAPR